MVTMAMAGLTLAGCDDDRQLAEEIEPALVDPADITVPPVVDANPLQDEILADGSVTPEEMEQALNAVVGCVESQGFDAVLKEFDPEGGWSFEVGHPTATSDAAGDALTRCERAFLSEIELPFSQQHGPTEQEIKAEREARRQCLLARGYTPEEIEAIDPTAIDIADLVACDPDL